MLDIKAAMAARNRIIEQDSPRAEALRDRLRALQIEADAKDIERRHYQCLRQLDAAALAYFVHQARAGQAELERLFSEVGGGEHHEYDEVLEPFRSLAAVATDLAEQLKTLDKLSVVDKTLGDALVLCAEKDIGAILTSDFDGKLLTFDRQKLYTEQQVAVHRVGDYHYIQRPTSITTRDLPESDDAAKILGEKMAEQVLQANGCDPYAPVKLYIPLNLLQIPAATKILLRMYARLRYSYELLGVPKERMNMTFNIRVPAQSLEAAYRAYLDDLPEDYQDHWSPLSIRNQPLPTSLPAVDVDGVGLPEFASGL